ncbi:MAG: hypothetical protein NZ805_14595 [Armatimonadetes bacterium]|nr:hypothetical protein [Armatimonadota bacterium]
MMSHGEQECPDCGAKALPLMLCRTCGWDFLAAYEPEDAKGQLRPWVQSGSSEQTVFLYELPEAGIEVDTEEVADTEEEFLEEGVEARATAQVPQLRTWRICPKCLAIVRNGRCPSGCSVPLQKFAVKKQRGTICPVCRSRYGSRDVLTKVSMGVSRALKEVARTLIQNLPGEQRKVLIFCDSRQDAAHQTWFINNTEKRLQIRRAVYDRLHNETEPHGWDWLKNKVLEWLVEKGYVKEPRTKDARNRELEKVEGGLLTEFAIQPNVRQSLERLGLVRVRQPINHPFLQINRENEFKHT